MKALYLFPQSYKTIGWVLFIPGILGMLFCIISEFDTSEFMKMKVFAIINNDFLSDSQSMTLIANGVFDEIVFLLITVGGLLVGFSKQGNEDEFISKIRYESLVWAVYVNVAVMILATVFVYGIYYLNVMMANMFTLLLFFIIRFHIMLYKLNNSMEDEE